MIQLRKKPLLIKIIVLTLGLVLGAILQYRLIYLPAQSLVRTLEDRYAWLETQLKASSLMMPAMDYPEIAALPVLLDGYQREFVEHGVKVDSLNMERFESTGDSPAVQYALIRLSLQGPWDQIAAGVVALEKDYPYLKLIDMKLDETGGQGVLQIMVQPD